MEFNTNDFDQCSKLIWSITNKEYRKYELRVKYTKLDKEDFYQTGWVAMQDCINKNINDLSYICVAIRNAMYRQVQKTSTLSRTSDKKAKWDIISGSEVRLSDISEDVNTIIEFRSFEEDVINSVLVGQIFENASKEDKIEILRIMNNLPPKRRKVRQNCKLRARQILDGKNPYKQKVADKQSKIVGVNYDKSKDRWIFCRRVNGKMKTFIRNKDKEVVENYAREYFSAVM